MTLADRLALTLCVLLALLLLADGTFGLFHSVPMTGAEAEGRVWGE